MMPASACPRAQSSAASGIVVYLATRVLRRPIKARLGHDERHVDRAVLMRGGGHRLGAAQDSGVRSDIVAFFHHTHCTLDELIVSNIGALTPMSRGAETETNGISDGTLASQQQNSHKYCVGSSPYWL